MLRRTDGAEECSGLRDGPKVAGSGESGVWVGSGFLAVEEEEREECGWKGIDQGFGWI